MYVVLTPLIALALFRARIGVLTWAGIGLATAGLALLSGVHAGSVVGDVLVLAGAAVYSLQIVLMERYAPRYDAIAFTLVEMLAAFGRSEEHTSELQSHSDLVCRLLLEKKKKQNLLKHDP